MLFCFVTVYIDKNDKWVIQNGAIAAHYIKGWFPIDLLSVGVSGIDIYAVTSKLAASSAGSDDKCANAPAIVPP